LEKVGSIELSCVNFAWSGRHLRQKRPRH